MLCVTPINHDDGLITYKSVTPISHKTEFGNKFYLACLLRGLESPATDTL